MSARRSLFTATAAGALLGALWFVPSANATATFRSPEAPDSSRVVHTEQRRATLPSDDTADAAGTTDTAAPADARLADTGAGVDTTPYLIGGTAFLGLGAGFVAYSVRREQRGPAY
ncbi:hypothetical protein GCM10009837_26780 [Streptomyces durmitorensis]|uniref:LPXTG-motif cell wall anchor domain-containing protein n=1 Tax=Streptomyces durmitorensis TaxID=319947 RepID=A0ABY4PUC4_9ACTN|nr:hypothetical protein [Streptomyces durmitorensis]UQT56667.1 hypothetical protein M4V62_17045 [Streptomyces durmitorensis]